MEALATKYRPRTFKDVICQDNVKKVLSNQLETKEIKQAYLFCGSSGTGKTTCARIFANDVNEGKKQYIGGGEESYGFLAEDFVRDKDAVSACSLLASISQALVPTCLIP